MTNIEANGDNVGSAFFNKVPVVTVHKENIDQVKETLITDIQVFNNFTYKLCDTFKLFLGHLKTRSL